MPIRVQRSRHVVVGRLVLDEIVDATCRDYRRLIQTLTLRARGTLLYRIQILASIQAVSHRDALWLVRMRTGIPREDYRVS